MRITPFITWLSSIIFLFIVSIFLPFYRMLLYLLIAAHFPIFAIGIKNMRMQFFGKVYFHISKRSNKIAITFDDGPDPNLTHDIINVLKKHNIKATFFIIANQAEQHADIVKKCFDEGHTIACHDLKHSVFSNFRTTAPLLRDISKAQHVIERIIGRKPLLYRPPVGLMNPHVLKALHKLNMQCIGWSKSAGDAGNRRISKIYRINTLSGQGEVILLHDTLPNPKYKQEILNQLEKLCCSIKDQNLEAVSINEMFNIQAYE